MSNFTFLQPEWPGLHEAASKAEALVHADPRVACIYARLALEGAMTWLYTYDAKLKLPYQDNLSALIHEPTFKAVAGEAVFTKARVIQRQGNDAVHNARRWRSWTPSSPPSSTAPSAGSCHSALISSEKSYCFSDEMARPRSNDNLENRILARIREQEPGKVFASVEFLDMGSRAAVDQALARLCRAGAIQRARRGLFYIPRVSQHFGPLKAAADEVAQAIARRDGLRIQEGGAYAANAMGLTEQVPARTIYDTDGPSRKVSIMGSKAVIEFKHRSPRRMAGAGRVTGMTISALANIGRRHVTTASLGRLRRELKPEHKRQLLADLALAPAWMHPHLRHIAEEPESTP